jgi:hypothetical protein
MNCRSHQQEEDDDTYMAGRGLPNRTRVGDIVGLISGQRTFESRIGTATEIIDSSTRLQRRMLRVAKPLYVVSVHQLPSHDIWSIGTRPAKSRLMREADDSLAVGVR